MNADDRNFVLRVINSQPGWSDTPATRRQLLLQWLGVGEGHDENIHFHISHMALTNPGSAADEVLDKLETVEMSRGVNALAAVLGALTPKIFADSDRLSGIIGQLPSLSSANGTKKEKSLIFDIPHNRNNYFIGRDQILIDLLDRSKSEHMQALSGLGGIGKTQTALEYAYRYRDEYKYLFWVQGDSRTSICSGYERIAELLELPRAAVEDPQSYIKSTLTWLEQTSDYLLVIDNVDVPKEVVDLLPKRPAGHVLMTSREQYLESIGLFEPVHINDLPSEEAVAFLARRSMSNKVEDLSSDECTSAEKLAKELGYLPLALEQAAAYIRANDMTFEGYLDEYKTLQLDLLSEQGPVAGDYQDSVRTTWWKSIERVRKTFPASADLLTVCAFMAPDNIPFEFVIDGAAELGENVVAAFANARSPMLALNGLLEPLSSYSLIKRDRQSKTFHMHNMVQAVVRVAMSEEDRAQWLDRMLSALAVIYPGKGALEWSRCERLITHWLAIAELKDGENFVSAAAVLNQAGYYFYERALYRQSKDLYERSLSIRARILGGDHLDVAESLSNLAQLYTEIGQFTKALILQDRSLSIREQALGPDHLHVAESLRKLAVVYPLLGKIPESLSLLDRSLSIRERIFGPDYLDVTESLNDLTQLYTTLRRFPETLILHDRHLSSSKTSRSQASEDLSSLTGLYKILGCYTDAPKLTKRSLYIFERFFCSNHFVELKSLVRQIVLYSILGCHSDSLMMLERSVLILKRDFSSNHRHLVAESQVSLAELYLVLCRRSKSLTMLGKTLSISERICGYKHPWIAVSLGSVALVYFNLGRYSDALPLLDRSVSILEHNKSNDAKMASIIFVSAAVRHKLGDGEGALKFMNRSIAIMTTVSVDRHPCLISLLKAKSVILRELGKYREADETNAEAAAVQERYKAWKRRNNT